MARRTPAERRAARAQAAEGLEIRRLARMNEPQARAYVERQHRSERRALERWEQYHR